MTELQKKEFEILKLFVDTCKKLELEYFLVCGSALGAVKYGGFIPWDDDIDVAMPRKDYETFLSKAPELLPEWCFIQNYRTDPEFHLLGTKIRDSRTTFIEMMCDGLDINHGIFIDLFPLDGMWGPSEEKIYQRKRKQFDAARRVKLNYRRFTPGNVFPLLNTVYFLAYKCLGLFRDTDVEIKKFDDFVSSFPLEDSDIWCNHANSASRNEFALKDQYGKGRHCVFEGLDVVIPQNYDEYLSQKYGEWRKELPIDEQKGHHYYVIMDCERPYVDYIKNISKIK